MVNLKKHYTDLSTELLEIYPNGGKVIAYKSINYDTEDFQKIFFCASFFAKQGHTVTITPKLNATLKNPAYKIIYGNLLNTQYYGKCPDFEVNGTFYEHEGYQSSNMKKAFRNMLNHGSKQSNRIIVDDCGLTTGYMLRSIASRITIGIEIKEIWIRNGENLRLLYKTEGQ